MANWRDHAWYQVQALKEALGPGDGEARRRERMWVMIETYAHADHKEAQFHQLHQCTEPQVALLTSMLAAPHIRAELMQGNEAPVAAQPGPEQARLREAPTPAEAAEAEPVPTAELEPALECMDQPALGCMDDPEGAMELHLPAPPPKSPPPIAEPDPDPQAPVPTSTPVAAPPPTSKKKKKRFAYVPFKKKQKSKTKSASKLYQEAMECWNRYISNERRPEADARAVALEAARVLQQVVGELAKAGADQLDAVLETIDLTASEVESGALEKRLR